MQPSRGTSLEPYTSADHPPEVSLDVETDHRIPLPETHEEICGNIQRMQRTQVDMIGIPNRTFRLGSGYRG